MINFLFSWNMKNAKKGIAINISQPPRDKERIDANNAKPLAATKKHRSVFLKKSNNAAIKQIKPISMARLPKRMAFVKPSARPIVLY